MSNADRQKRYRDRVASNAHNLLESVTRTCDNRNAPVTESVSFAPAGVTGRPSNVTRKPDRNAQEVTPQDGPGSTNAEPMVVEHPLIQAMSIDELIRRLHFIKDWKQSPEYSEVMRRKGEAVGACA